VRTHKSAEQLIEETEEIVKELRIYDIYKENLLKSLDAVDSDYKNKKLNYLTYERKLRSILKDKTKDGWITYYNSYQYSLLKKIEFIASQLFNLVYDDVSYSKLVVSKPSLIPISRKPKKIEVFNIDNEIDRLKNILREQYSPSEVDATIKKFDFKLQGLDELQSEISQAEEVAKIKIEEQQAVIDDRLTAAKVPIIEKVKLTKKVKFSIPSFPNVERYSSFISNDWFLFFLKAAE